MLLYAPLLMKREGAHNGQTWGKQVVGIRVVRDNGQPFDFGSAALREVVFKSLCVWIASSIIPFLPGSWTTSGRCGTTRTARCTTWP